MIFSLKILRFHFHPLLFFLFIAAPLLSQDDEDPVLDFDASKIKMSLLSLRLDAGIPNPISSEVVRKKFVGVYEVSGCLNVRLAKMMSLGVGYENSLMSVSNRVRFGVKTKMQTHTGFARFSFNRYHRNAIFSTLFLNGGYSQIKFTDVVCLDNKLPNKNHSFYFLEPGYSLNFLAEENMTLGFFISYSVSNYLFNPNHICLEDWTPLDNLESTKNFSVLSFGLEMYWGLSRKK